MSRQRRLLGAALAVAMVLFAGCGREAPKAEPLRPVLTMVVAGVLLVAGPTAVGSQIVWSFASIGHLVSSLVELALVLGGVAYLLRSRLRAYGLLRLSVLVSIFCGQGFLFYEQQLGALGGMAVDLLMLTILDAMIAGERAQDTAS